MTRCRRLASACQISYIPIPHLLPVTTALEVSMCNCVGGALRQVGNLTTEYSQYISQCLFDLLSSHHVPWVCFASLKLSFEFLNSCMTPCAVPQIGKRPSYIFHPDLSPNANREPTVLERGDSVRLRDKSIFYLASSKSHHAEYMFKFVVRMQRDSSMACSSSSSKASSSSKSSFDRPLELGQNMPLNDSISSRNMPSNRLPLVSKVVTKGSGSKSSGSNSSREREPNMSPMDGVSSRNMFAIQQRSQTNNSHAHSKTAAANAVSDLKSQTMTRAQKRKPLSPRHTNIKVPPYQSTGHSVSPEPSSKRRKVSKGFPKNDTNEDFQARSRVSSESRRVNIASEQAKKKSAHPEPPSKRRKLSKGSSPNPLPRVSNVRKPSESFKSTATVRQQHMSVSKYGEKPRYSNSERSVLPKNVLGTHSTTAQEKRRTAVVSPISESSKRHGLASDVISEHPKSKRRKHDVPTPNRQMDFFEGVRFFLDPAGTCFCNAG